MQPLPCFLCCPLQPLISWNVTSVLFILFQVSTTTMKPTQNDRFVICTVSICMYRVTNVGVELEPSLWQYDHP